MTRDDRDTYETHGAEGNVEVWAVNTETGETTRTTAQNVTCVGGHELMLDAARASTTTPGIQGIAVGVGGTSGTDPQDRTLNNQVGTGTVFTTRRQGREAAFRCFVPSQVTAQQSIDEVGLVTGNDGDLVNHAVISPVDKSHPDTVLIVTVTLTLGDVSEASDNNDTIQQT